MIIPLYKTVTKITTEARMASLKKLNGYPPGTPFVNAALGSEGLVRYHVDVKLKTHLSSSSSASQQFVLSLDLSSCQTVVRGMNCTSSDKFSCRGRKLNGKYLPLDESSPSTQTYTRANYKLPQTSLHYTLYQSQLSISSSSNEIAGNLSIGAAKASQGLFVESIGDGVLGLCNSIGFDESDFEVMQSWFEGVRRRSWNNGGKVEMTNGNGNGNWSDGFGLFLPRSGQVGELSVGGLNADRFSGNVQWAPSVVSTTSGLSSSASSTRPSAKVDINNQLNGLYFPVEAFLSIQRILNATYDADNGLYIVDCALVRKGPTLEMAFDDLAFSLPSDSCEYIVLVSELTVESVKINLNVFRYRTQYYKLNTVYLAYWK
ncbi:hypothetical protein HDU76_003317 [Blyttiomyces sp. JEL0837]|nr:hypothetical protein HDU76_003317 [Blyttiomyces sp. JEL0837]